MPTFDDIFSRYRRPDDFEDVVGTAYDGKSSASPFDQFRRVSDVSRVPPSPPELRAHDEPWYRRVPNNVIGAVDAVRGAFGAEPMGPSGREYTRKLFGTENPLNIPGQMHEGVDTMLGGYSGGDWGRVAGGAIMAAAPFIPMPGKLPTGAMRPRAIDPLGFYSHAVESAHALPQAKGTPEQMLAQLKNAGVKDAEIEATGLRGFLADKPFVSRDEITKHLEGNRVGLNEVNYGGGDGKPWDAYSDPGRRSRAEAERPVANGVAGPSKWQPYSLDPSNPTYRETVLHLPGGERVRDQPSFKTLPSGEVEWTYPNGQGGVAATEAIARDEAAALSSAIKLRRNPKDFQSGHFPEPNIVGHTMTSMTSHEGKPVHTIDQIQSDWGQKLRDGGARDEAKIAELKSRVDASRSSIKESIPQNIRSLAGNYEIVVGQRDAMGRPIDPAPRVKSVIEDIKRRGGINTVRDALAKEDQLRMLEAELATATSSAPGHPLVNTTDQWLRPTLHKSLMQAIDANADHIAIPSGKTVLSYNPGNEHGMGEFYDKIVPKNLHNILKKIDKNTPGPQRVEKLQTPGKGLAGDGFTLFPLTDEVKTSVRQNGLPLFSSAAAALLAGGALQDSNPWDKPIKRDDK